MMVGNEDKLESYLMSSLVNHKYNNRYSDIDISEFIKQNKLFPVNFSSFCKSPTSIDMDISVLSSENHPNAYYGYPRYVYNDETVSDMNYDYTFNVYDNTDITYPLIRKNGYDDEYYLKYDSETLSDHGYVKYDYSNDVRLVTELTKYLTTVYSCINELQTDYDKPFIRNVSCDNMITNITHHISVIRNYIRSNRMSLPQSYQIAETIDTQLNPIIDIDKDFYRHFFKSYKFIEKYLSISVIGFRDGKQISYSDLSSVKIPYPPLEEQEKIGKILNCCDEEIQILNSKLEKLKEQKKGLMQKLLTGQIRVKI
jgi:hypothetical protein